MRKQDENIKLRHRSRSLRFAQDRWKTFYSQKHQGKDRFMPVSRHCPYGYGIENKCLMPFYTAAADLSRKTQRQWRAGDVIYIPKIQGVRLPDGKTHNGFLTIADTGSGFHNTGRTRRIDVFVGSSSYRDFWKHHGISRHRPIEIYKVRGVRKQALSRLTIEGVARK